jgi:hypothetical protein
MALMGGIEGAAQDADARALARAGGIDGVMAAAP